MTNNQQVGCKCGSGYYEPKPVDTSAVVLSSEILALCELLAKNAHDTWAVKKMVEGFTYGTGEDQSNMLKPYALLDDAEKQVNRKTVLEAIKTLITMGFAVEVPKDVVKQAQQALSIGITIDNYKPEPIDISNVVIGPDVESAADALSFNAHEVWSVDRLQNGWTWAEVRNNDLKYHPLIKPYEELTESEKSYDLDLAFGTLKAIVALGGKIIKK